MNAQNCWEVKNCGREVNGLKVSELGICPATNDQSCDGINDGKAGGRICWAVTGTFCGAKIQGTFAQKQLSCMSCDFFKKVREEQGTAKFQMMKPGQTYKKYAQ